MLEDSPADRPARRVRYRGKNPRRFEEKYKEHEPGRYSETIAKVLDSGKTPAGSHRPIMVREVLAALDPKPGEIAVDCTLGYGGHARKSFRFFTRAADCSASTPIRLSCRKPRRVSAPWDSMKRPLPRTEPTSRDYHNSWPNCKFPVDLILADLGVSSMQLDNPRRGFSLKLEGLLDLRMNPERGFPASILLQKLPPEKLARLLLENADELNPALATSLAGRTFSTTLALADAIRAALPSQKETDRELSVRRVFQALRIAVNDEFSALDMFLRNLPACLNPGGRVAILTFHSGEDRRVKKAFAAGLRDRCYSEVASEVVRPSSEECRANPRATSAKLRWARRG